MYFKIVSSIVDVEIIATGSSIRENSRLKKYYGRGHWRKMKGYAWVDLDDGAIYKAEIHWYEAHGIGKKEFKIKRFVGEKS